MNNPTQHVVLIIIKIQPNGQRVSPLDIWPLARRSLQPLPGKVWRICEDQVAGIYEDDMIIGFCP
jgi:hypothetical protein